MICRFEIGDMDFGFGFDTPCLVYDKGGGSLRAFRRAWFLMQWFEDFLCNGARARGSNGAIVP